MADNEKASDPGGQRTEKNTTGRPCTSRVNEHRTPSKIRHRLEDVELPAPPPDPWTSPWRLQNPRGQVETQTESSHRNLDDDEDIIAYLTDFSAYEGQTSECPSRNSAVSAMAISNVYTEDAFEHLDRLYAFAEQILELRSRNSKFFKRVRNLERLKVLRNANHRLENAFLRDKDVAINVCEEDTGFAESLLDAMLSNCRDSSYQKRGARSSSSRQTRNKLDIDKQTSFDEVSGGAPKVSKWTRVKAAFKWERAYTNDSEVVDSTMTNTLTNPTTAANTSGLPLSSPTTKYHKSLDFDVRETNNATASSSVNESCNVGTPFGRTSSPSSLNDGFYDCTQKSGSKELDCLFLKRKNDKKTEYTSWHRETLDDNIVILDTLRVNETGLTNEVNQGKPLVRKNQTNLSVNKADEKDTELTSKRSTPTLTITIPSHEEDIRYTSSPESNSPLLFNANISGGNSPQPRKTFRDLSINKDFKRQQSFGGESKTHRQDSKWNKVRRAFLTNSNPSVSRQTFLHDGPESSSVSNNYNGSAENIEKTPSNAQVDTRQDYRALREKLGSEFHQKLVEWERLKNLPPRTPTKDTRELSSSLPSPRESLLSEERLAPEFRKKLQDWKRAKKERRGSAPFEQQRINRRRLTDWQLWRSPSKTEYRNKENTGSYGSCESGETVNDGKSQFCEDFGRKIEGWRKTYEANNGHDAKYSMRSKSNQIGIASGIDESEFYALERLLSLFNGNLGKGRQGSEAQQLDECFDGEPRTYIDGTQVPNDTNEVLVQTSVGSYRFEGISREFTRKLYDWEQYRGISPTSSTFRLLGSAYIPFLRQTTIEAATEDSAESKDRNDEPVFKAFPLKRSKSAESVIGKPVQDEFYMRRSSSLQSVGHLTNRLQSGNRVSTLPMPINPQRREDIAEDIAEDIMDDSEPEAMIVDIEDVIEETASPLERVQPHQTPVYSVAASETTSIAVPLGTVTSSHEPSPVFLIEIEENTDNKLWESKKWKQRKSFSSEDSLSIEQSDSSKTWNNRRNSLTSNNIDLDHWSSASSSDKKETLTSITDNVDTVDYVTDKDSAKSVKSIISICSTEVDAKRSVIKESKKIGYEDQANFEREDIPVAPSDDNHAMEQTRENVLDAQSKLATCRYNQELSSKKQHEREDSKDTQRIKLDRNNDDGKYTGSTSECNNEYEEVILDTSSLRCCSLKNAQSVANYSEKKSRISPEKSVASKLDKANHTTRDVDFFHANQQDENSKDLQGNYNAIKEEQRDTCRDLSRTKLDLNSCGISECSIRYSNRERQSSYYKEVTTNSQSIQRKEWQEYRDSQNVSTSSISRATNSSTVECELPRPEPTIKTTVYTVEPSREERCFERIIINEETLNKIVVPTATTGRMEASKTSKQPSGSPTTEDSSEEHPRSSTDREVPPNQSQEANVKKQSTNSPTRNVFIRTKRIIFSPFRRLEEHSAKKENNTSEEDQVFPTKSKSKSRSGSPKINRQDALLRMSLSLPWPLRPSSKDRETKETAKIEGNGKETQVVPEKQNFERSKSVESSRKSSANESNLFQAKIKEETRIVRDRNSSVELTRKNGELKHSGEQKTQRASVSVQAIPNEQQTQASFRVSLPSLKTDEKTRETSTSSTSSTKFDPQSSDLIHKLTILSNVVARRDGRTNTISEDSSLESHSLRIRRAKEDFLSRRGGPLCHSALESPSGISVKRESSPRTFPHYYEQISENQEKLKCRNAMNANHVFGSVLDEVSNNRDARQEAVKEKKVEQMINEYNEKEMSNSSIVSRPDRVKSASAGMINVDPDTFVRLTETNRGCESLPRSISKQQQPLGSLAKIVSKFKFARLIRGKDGQEQNMSTISKLCRQSLLIDVRNDFEKCWESSDREKVPKMDNVEKSKKNE